MFQGKQQLLSAARQIGIGIAEGMQVTTAAQGLTGYGALLFGGMVHQHDGTVEGSLKLAQETEQA